MTSSAAATAAQVEAGRGRGDVGRGVARAAAPYAIAAVASFGLLVPLLHLWDADLRVPFYGGGDATWMLVHFRTVIEHGWWVDNPDVGAPFGMDLRDFPIGANNAFFVGIKVLGLFSRDFIAVENVYYLLTYPVVAVAALSSLRRIGVSTAVSVAMAVVFALSPYHVFRAQGHMFLGASVTVPLAGWIAVALASHGRDATARVVAPSTVALVLVGILMGTASEYYAVFGLIVIGASAAVGAIGSRSWRPLAIAGTLAAVVTVTMAVNLAPGLLYRASHGRNPDNVSQRLPQEAESFAGKPASLLLPVPGHRIAALRDLRARYDRDFPLPAEPQAIGTLAALGLVGLMGVALVSIAGAGTAGGALDRFRPLSLGALVALAFGTVGGGATFLALGGFTSIRAWNRMSIVVAFFAVAAVGVALDLAIDALRRRRARHGRRVPAVAVTAALAALTIAAGVDQVSPVAIPAYAAAEVDWANLRAYADAVEARAGAGAVIAQLPYVPFPESPQLVNMIDYDHFRVYVASKHLRWTYGAMRGRPADWTAALASAPTDTLVTSFAAAGIAGISVDRAGYADNGAAVETGLARWLGRPTVVSRDDRLSFFDLAPLRRRVAALPATTRDAARRATLYPVRTGWNGFHGLERLGADSWRWSKGDATIDLVNPGPSPRTVEISFAIEGYTDPPHGPRTIRLRLPGVDRRVGFLPEQVRPFSFRTVLPPGTSALELTSDLPALTLPARDPRSLAIRVVNLRVTPAAVQRVVGAVAPAPSAASAASASPGAQASP